MMDRDTSTVIYRDWRAESRGKLKRGEPLPGQWRFDLVAWASCTRDPPPSALGRHSDRGRIDLVPHEKWVVQHRWNCEQPLA